VQHRFSTALGIAFFSQQCTFGPSMPGFIYSSSIRASAERAAEARKVAGRLACEAWNQRMLGYRGPAQPSPTTGMVS
jgi:hypothetical protein